MRSNSMQQPALSPSPRRRSRRPWRLLAVWLLVGLLAAAGSTAWASGFAISTAEITDATGSEPVLATASSTTSAPEWVNPGPTPLAIRFTGAWAYFDDSAYLFDIDLSDADPDHRYQVGVYATADLGEAGWTDLQLQFVLADGSCNDADLGAPLASEALNLLAAADAGWVVALDGGTRACVGVPAADRASDASGTFARRANSSVIPTPPSFTASANRIE